MPKKLVWLLLLFPLFAFAYTNPGQPSGFVNDYAGVLTPDQGRALENKLSAFEKETGNEISVVTVKNLGGDTIENFAVRLFRDWGIGKKNKDNGVLLLIAKEDRRMRIEVGYGLEGALTDLQSFWIIDNIMKPAFRAGDYYGGIDKAVDKVSGAAKGEYVPSQTVSSQGKSAKGGLGFFWLVFFVPVWLASILGRSKSWWAGGVIGGIIGVIIGFVYSFIFIGVIAIVVLIPLGLLFDFIVSRSYARAKDSGRFPWWIGGSGFGGGGGGGFGGFGGGGSGGGGSSGSW